MPRSLDHTARKWENQGLKSLGLLHSPFYHYSDTPLLSVCACVCTSILVVVRVLRSHVHTLSAFLTSLFKIIIFDTQKAVHNWCIQLGKFGNRDIPMKPLPQNLCYKPIYHFQKLSLSILFLLLLLLLFCDKNSQPKITFLHLWVWEKLGEDWPGYPASSSTNHRNTSISNTFSALSLRKVMHRKDTTEVSKEKECL